MTKAVQIALDCTNPRALADFWADALEYEIQLIGDGSEKMLVADPNNVGPRLFLHRVPEGKVVKNRLHLDVIASGWGTPPERSRPIVEAEAERLCARGATIVDVFDKPDDFFIVMRDPEGNEFCIG